MAYGETQFGEVNPHPHFGLAETLMRDIAILRREQPDQYVELLRVQYNSVPYETRVAIDKSFPPDATKQHIANHWTTFLMERMIEFANDVEQELPALISAAELGDL